MASAKEMVAVGAGSRVRAGAGRWQAEGGRCQKETEGTTGTKGARKEEGGRIETMLAISIYQTPHTINNQHDDHAGTT